MEIRPRGSADGLVHQLLARSFEKAAENKGAKDCGSLVSARVSVGWHRAGRADLLEQCSFTGGRQSSLAMSVFLMVKASST